VRYVPTVKKYLLGRIRDVEVPESIRLQFEHVESLPMEGLELILAAGLESPKLPGLVDENLANEGMDQNP
jgi:hypothetical protein